MAKRAAAVQKTAGRRGRAGAAGPSAPPARFERAEPPQPLPEPLPPPPPEPSFHQDGLDPAFYRAHYADMALLSHEDLRRHWFEHGILEGRMGTPHSVRERFRELIPTDSPVLEIGPFAFPYVRGPLVKYADVLDTEALRARAQRVGIDPAGCPHIDFPLTTMNLSLIPEIFTGVVSSHCIEHQPDLVGHLLAVERLLDAGGRYFLIVPDKRFCFDHYLPESHIAQVVDARAARLSRHTLGKVIEHRALVTHNVPARHWAGDHEQLDPYQRLDRIKDAIREYKAAEGGYVDVHAWQFTPNSFRTVMACLEGLGMIRLRVLAVYDTVRPRNEFCAILEKPR